jgi:hypothetical protein
MTEGCAQEEDRRCKRVLDSDEQDKENVYTGKSSDQLDLSSVRLRGSLTMATTTTVTSNDDGGGNKV